MKMMKKISIILILIQFFLLTVSFVQSEAIPFGDSEGMSFKDSEEIAFEEEFDVSEEDFS